MRVLWFLIKEGFRNLVRSKFAGAFTILVIWLSLFFVGVGFIVSRDMVGAVEELRSQFDINVFLNRSATQSEIDNFTNKLENINEIEQYRLIDKNDAAQKFKEEFGEEVFDVLGYNPLPVSYNIKLKKMFRNLASVESITSTIAESEIVDEIRYKKKFLVLLQRYQRKILYILVGGYLVLALVSIILISNSIKMGIFSRRKIISTMKLIGATDNFVRAPFIIEGILQGIIGALLSSGLIYGLAYIQNNYLQSILKYKVELNLELFLLLVVFGGFMGIVGSLRAIKKFL